MDHTLFGNSQQLAPKLTSNQSSTSKKRRLTHDLTNLTHDLTNSSEDSGFFDGNQKIKKFRAGGHPSDSSDIVDGISPVDDSKVKVATGFGSLLKSTEPTPIIEDSLLNDIPEDLDDDGTTLTTTNKTFKKTFIQEEGDQDQEELSYNTDSRSRNSSGSGSDLDDEDFESAGSRARMLSRFISHVKANPNDAQLQHFFNLLISGPEFTPVRSRLRHVTTIEDAARLLRCSKKILVLTGAGISVSCGIPDFRSKDGLYSRVSKVFPELQDPQSVFDIRLFRSDPRPFFLTAKELYPGLFKPSLSHRFIQKLEENGQLLRNYSQNIDTLESIAGIKNVTECHGSFATATCLRCKFKVKGDDIKEKVFAGEIPYCPKCSTQEETDKLQYPLTPSVSNPNQMRRASIDDDDQIMYLMPDPLPVPPILKPDITFFGEDLPAEFHNNLQNDKLDCDLLLVIGSSMRVRPVSCIPSMLPKHIPQILINRESLGHINKFDVELLGNCDLIIQHLCEYLDSSFKEFVLNDALQEIDEIPLTISTTTTDKGFQIVAVDEPKSLDDVNELRACWEPKKIETIAEKLPAGSFLKRFRRYFFEGAEELYDPDDDSLGESDESSDSDSESSFSSLDFPSPPKEKEISSTLNENKPTN